jgi:hypothetical protein
MNWKTKLVLQVVLITQYALSKSKVMLKLAFVGSTYLE